MSEPIATSGTATPQQDGRNPSAPSEPLEAQTLAPELACEMCGRRDGLDAVVNDHVWARLSEAAGGANILCLWCMDGVAAELGLQAQCNLFFAGRALSSCAQSPREQIKQLTAALRLAQAMVEDMERLMPELVAQKLRERNRS